MLEYWTCIHAVCVTINDGNIEEEERNSALNRCVTMFRICRPT